MSLTLAALDIVTQLSIIVLGLCWPSTCRA